jgi:2-polyprenyl-3-methyl-5-hydroxy-6-metoxy-1,4-benzoquinol methylase
MKRSPRARHREADRQKLFYDGKVDGYTPVYQDAQAFSLLMAQQVEGARRHGMFGCSLKAVRNRRELDRLALKPGEKVLDAGCGGGLLLNQLAARYDVDGTGVDLAPLAVQRAKSCGDPKLRYRLAQLERLPFKDGSFDAVLSFDVLEHVQDKEAVLKELLRVLKPGGRFLFYAISRRDAFTWHWCLRVASFGRLGQDNEAGHVHALFLDPRATRRSLAALGAVGLSLGYLHSFFSLAMDEAVFFGARRRSRAAVAAPRHGAGAKGQRLAVGVPRSKRLLYQALRALSPLTELMELPWKLLGLSNGFFIRGQK